MSARRVKDKYSSERGQTLNEAIIAVSLLTFGVIGMLGGLVRSYSQTSIIADRMTATFLAAEGVEIAKNIVDGRSMRNSISKIDPSGARWRDDFPVAGRYYQLDFYDTTADRQIIGNPDAVNGLTDSEKNALLSMKYTSPAFNYTTGTDTIFRRVIGAPISDGNRMKIRSYVYWKARNGVWHDVSAETDLLNWR